MRAPAFWTIRHGRDAAPMLRLFLSPLGWLYGASVARRLAKATPVRLPIPVISLGNISVGGTGKTPLAHLIRAELSQLLGGPVAIVSRGYGGTLEGPVRVDPTRHTAKQVGDEPLMLAADGPVIVARDRAAGGRFGATQGMKAIVLDDAHQNPALAKDLSIVVVDGSTGFGNGFLVPAGPLREPVLKGLARADVVVTMGQVSDETADDLASFKGVVLGADLVPAPTQIAGKVLGFCGIGRPEKFDATLKALGLDVADMFPFPDHHPYSEADLQRLSAAAHDYDATLVTTQKDFVRLPAEFAQNVRVIPVTAQLYDPVVLRGMLVGALDTVLARA
jgi:tetraacyldisaccharide 4'-kinase